MYIRKLSNKTINKINLKYGLNFLEDFERLFLDNNWTQALIAKKYNLSREYIRQLFDMIYKTSYQPLKEKKIISYRTIKHKNKIIEYEKKIIKALASIPILDNCSKNNLKINILKKFTNPHMNSNGNKSISFIINNHNIKLCILKIPHAHWSVLNGIQTGSKTLYYQSTPFLTYPRSAFDFIIFYFDNNFYIVPSQVVPKHVYIRAIPYRRSAFGKSRKLNPILAYKNRWDLLN